MKIAYVARVNFEPQGGVTKKLVQQLRSWVELGSDARLFLLTHNQNLAEFIRKENLGIAFFYDGGPFSRSRCGAFDNLISSLLDWQPQVIYLRWDFINPHYMRLFSLFPVVVEVNTNVLGETWILSKVHFFYSLFSQEVMNSKVAGLIFVCHEISELSLYKNKRILKKVIGNGIFIRDIQTLLPSQNTKPRLVFLGEPTKWHGIDKILRLAFLKPDWDFHLIGPKETSATLANVYIHGFLSYQQYLPIVAQSDVAIGTLALHRNRMNEASPLKVREYLALGLPTIIGYKDTDFLQGAPFLLELPNQENNVEVSLKEIEYFVQEWKGKRVPRSAITHLDYLVKEKERLSFLEEVCAS